MVKSALIMGAGIAGIQASLDLAEQGFQVYLVERSPSIGGRMSQLDKTFPTMDCSACILTPRMVEVARHPNIQLLTYSEVKEISQSNGSFRVKVLRKPRYVNESLCTGCGLCESSCPVEVPNEFDTGLGVRKAIYIPFPQAVPLVYTIDMDHCILCGICASSSNCAVKAIDFEQTPKELDLEVGAIIIATGFNVFDARAKTEYGYGVYANVIDGLTMERLLSASGPTGGHLLRPSDGMIPRKIAYLQCVGSRDAKVGNTYCSRVCCMYATKQARILKEKTHNDGEVTIYYMDVRAFGKGYEEFLVKTESQMGVKYVKGRVAEIREDPKTRNLFLSVENIPESRLLEKEHDLVVLSAGLVANNSGVLKLLPLVSDNDGFLTATNPKLDPVTTSLEGVFIAGVAEGPKDIPDTVTQASAAAMKAAIFLSRRR